MSAKQIFGDKSLWTKSISNIELDMISKKLKLDNYRGTISRDNLSQFPVKTKESFIINLQPAQAGGGSHWCSLIRDGNRIFYFDSYGGGAPSDVYNRYPGISPVSSTFILQNMSNDTYCGILSMYVIYDYWKNGRNFFNTIMKIKKAYDQNDNGS
jgi:hypothetical protein